MDLIIDLQWRLELETDVRPKQIDRILVTLIFLFPNCASMDLDELMKMAEWLEEENFIEAKSYIDYLDRIHVRIQKMEKRFPTTDVFHGMQFQMHNQGQQLLPQNTIVSDGAKRSASLSPALPSMTSLTQTSVPNVAGLKKQSGIVKKMLQKISSQEQHHQSGKQNLLQPTQKSNEVGRRSTNRQSKTAHAQDLFQKQQEQQLLAQNTIVNDGAKRSASLSPALPSMTSLTQTSVPNVAGLKMQSGIVKNMLQKNSSQEQHHQLRKQNLLQPTQMSNEVGRRSTNTQSKTAHAQDLFQKQQEQQLMKQNLLQPTQMSNVVGRSTNTQSEIAHAQDLFQQKQQHQLMNPQLFSSSMNSSNAQTGQNADDWKEEIYQEMQPIKQRFLPYLKEIHQKTLNECQHLKRNDPFSNVPQCERQKLFLLDMLEGHMQILNVSKNGIIPAMKGNLSKFEKQVIHVIKSNWPQEPVSAQQQIQQPGGHPLSAQPQQQRRQEEEVDNQPDATNEIIDVITDSE